MEVTFALVAELLTGEPVSGFQQGIDLFGMQGKRHQSEDLNPIDALSSGTAFKNSCHRQ